MSEREVRWLGDLQRLDIKPGDKFVLTMPGSLSEETVSRIQQVWREFVGGDEPKILVLSAGMKLGVFGDAQDTESAA